ncbi:MAG: DEAD/DEAH box helicase family protein, partial [Bacteroidales bacterium]
MVTATNDNKPCQDLKTVDLNKYNIYPSYRVGQKEAIESILKFYEKIRLGDIKSKVVELPSATGSGKTVINRAVGKALLELYPDEIKKVVYTTPLKALVYQIEEDEQLGIPVVLGKSNYDCLLLEGLDASDCPFRSASLASRKPKICN